MSSAGLLTVVPDANVLIHGRALVDLPWGELGRDEIEVVFVPPVVREIDKLKVQTGRPNKIARQLSSDVREMIGGQEPMVVRKTGPHTVKRVELRQVTEAVHDGLRLDHADQALINYALHLMADGHDVLLLTDDTICGTTAQGMGLPVHFLPEHWLREAEPNESAKENAKLKAEVKRLQSAEPRVSVAFYDTGGSPIETLEASVPRWPALTGAEIDALMAEIQRLCPPAESFTLPPPRASAVLSAIAATNRFRHLAALHPRTVHEPATEEEIERYKSQEYPDWLAAIRRELEDLHRRLDARTQWPAVLAVATNEGTRPAQETLLAISASGAFTLSDEDAGGDEGDDENGHGKDGPKLELSLPPTPPRGHTKTIDTLGFVRAMSDNAIARIHREPLHIPTFTSPKPRRSDAFYWRCGRDSWVELMELECASWRHGQEGMTFKLGIRPDTMDDHLSGAIEVCIHAANLSDPMLARLPVRIAIENGSTVREAEALIERLGKAAQRTGRL